MKELRGKVVADKIKEDLKVRIQSLVDKGINPTIAIVRVGENDSDISYERAVVKVSGTIGLKVKNVLLKEETTTEELAKVMTDLNSDACVHGILMFRPLPRHIDQDAICNLIDPAKDVDAMNPVNLEKIFEGDRTGLEPATPRAAVEMILGHGYELKGKDVVVINRSMVVGKPLAMMLLNENATVTICHSKTADLKAHTKRADYVITALGRPAMLDKSYFSENSVVIDVGVGTTSDGKLSGDVNYDEVKDYVAAITPVPGGVGSITTTILLSQVVKACEQQTIK
ncbi:MAG: bifunctional 5,10-methylenetetrahydrofolate dehydrogenase/5,10-methenyltetrahydrofolate cyclohydrolase [Ezakiella sp.]|nr:bifunctional 5,10-methylenetetrahydrofolate dehydrogenase/5,10-methenyltetrahydrofolate cyclohydrolase [Ezakiella sp.]MDD7472035.1 bifunctional 5,10-methylenetetrahydrofolate dehydrogenase/5,10-methenyltetrahydrofolate cyclohydrolase [Bacillota bacterium]MDY3923999.1 bifunctional 5,10-methylenetetrahydrofolate dehydrogenase/5,10-methenyltetrahydrofolate cyclohydrolase [Ezakiella sp.]